MVCAPVSMVTSVERAAALACIADLRWKSAIEVMAFAFGDGMVLPMQWAGSEFASVLIRNGVTKTVACGDTIRCAGALATFV